MIAEARTRVPEAAFAVFDITQPLLLPADVIYARLLLGHLRDPHAALATWAKSLRPGSGIIVCEEPVRYRSDDPFFAKYEEVVTAVVSESGATLWAASVFDDDPPQCERVMDRVVEHPVPASRAAGMFWRNAVQWQDRTPEAAGLIQHFRGTRSRTRRRDRDVGTASGRVQEAARVMPAFFRTSGGTPNSRHAPYVMPLRAA